MKRIVFDFETRSCVDIKTCGAYKYAQHSSTDVTMAAILDIDKPENVVMWIGPKFRRLCPTEISDQELNKIVSECDLFVAHNAPFERAIWEYVMVRRYGFDPLPIEKTWDTAVQSSQAGLPRNLEQASAYINPSGTEKDMEGSRIMKRFISPRLPVSAKRKQMCPDNPDFIKEKYVELMEVLSKGGEADESYNRYIDWYEDEADFNRMVEYCRRDVIAEYNLFRLLPPIEDIERPYWVLDQQINDRGVLIDIESAHGIVESVEKFTDRLTKEAIDITGGAVQSLKSPKQIKDWLLSKGVEVDSIDKSSVEFLLSLDLAPEVRRFLEIRKTLGKSSLAKYSAMFATASNEDNRVRGLHAFYGASTGRFAGRLLQTQNLPRPSGKSNLIDPSEGDGDIDERAISLIASGDPELAEMWYKDINVLAADCIRAMLMAPKGRDFICSDFSAVEARALAYLSGEETELEAYRSGKDIYKVNAALIYGIPYEEVDGGGKGPQRQVGKTACLACGYSGGYSALCRFGFDKMPISEEDALHAISVMPDYFRMEDIEAFTKLHNVSPDEHQKKVTEMYRDPETHEMAESFLKEVKGTWIVKMWRQNHPNTTKFWYGMKQASIEAVAYPGTPIVCRGFTFCKKGRFLMMKLPSGRKLYYLDPKVEELTTPWGSTNQVVTSMSVNSMTHQIERRMLNISILVENAVQAFCRDLLCASLLRVSEHGYNPVAHIHDEILSEVPEGYGSVEEYEKLMSVTPPWAEGMPLKAAGGYRGKRYRK